METGVDIVTRARYVKQGGVHGWNLMHKLTSWEENVLAHTFLWSSIFYLIGSFCLYRKPILDELIKTYVSKGYIFQMEMIVRASRKHYNIEEMANEY